MKLFTLLSISISTYFIAIHDYVYHEEYQEEDADDEDYECPECKGTWEQDKRMCYLGNLHLYKMTSFEVYYKKTR